MKKKFLPFSMMLGICGLLAVNTNAQVGTTPGCPGAFGPTKIITGTNKTATIGSKITSNVTFHKDTIYILKDFIRVASGATLTIEPGTIVMGFPAPADTSCLIIERGGKLVANGTSALPIVFTSCKLQGTRNRGDWGGVVLLGKATNNLGTNIQLEGNYQAFHGGTDDNDNSGSLKFVRIEYAGLAFEPNKELNGITFGSVGRATTIQNIQVSYANDDSYEWFGGSVSTRNIIAWKGIDDDFDTDNGYHGYNQFGLSFRDPDIADFSGSNGFESDNNDPAADATFTILPKTTATFSNFEVWGPIQTSTTPFNAYYKRGAHLRRGTELKLYNTLFIGWPADSLQQQSSGLFVDGPQSTAFAVNDSLRLRNSIAAAYPPTRRILTNQPAAAWAPFASADAWYNKSTYFNTTKGNVLLDQKKAPFKAIPLFTTTSTSVQIATGSSFVTTGGSKPLPIGSYPNGFQSVAYRGAFGGTDWTANWTEFHPNLFVYTAGAPTRQAASEAMLNSGRVDASASSQLVCFPNPTNAGTTITFNLGYENVTIKNVQVKAGEVTVLNQLLKSDKEQVEVVIVGTKITNSETSVVEEVKKAVTVASGISGEQIKKGQDRDASEAVRRVAGITIIDNRFVMVRGLSERYNAVMLNNALTPSFEQDVKAFSFDIIPSSVIDRVLVYKAPAPELSGEFAGGAIKIYTSAIPDKNTFTVGYSSSLRQGTTFKDFKHPVRGSNDWLGYNDGTYQHPTGVPPDYSGKDPYKYDAIKVGRLFRNDTWLPVKDNAPLDSRVNINFTRKIKLTSDRIIGVVSSVNYSNTNIHLNGIRQQVPPGSTSAVQDPLYNYKEDLYTKNVTLGALLNTALKISTQHTFEFKNLYNHQGSSQYQELTGRDQGVGQSYYKRYMLLNTYRGLYSGQLMGTHDLSENTQFDWTIGLSKANREEPDVKRYMTAAGDPSLPYQFNIVQGANALYFGRIYGMTNEELKMSSGNLSHTFKLNDAIGFKPQIKMGWYFEEKRRQYQLKVYGLQNHLQTPDGRYYNDAHIENWTLDDLNNPRSWNNYNGLVITKGWDGGTGYNASNKLIAYYGGISLPYKDKFSIYGGVRVENNIQQVSKSTHLVSILPSVNASYNFTKKLLLRGAFGKTVNRPEFREIANLAFYDFYLFRSIAGNPNLKIPSIYNSELRLEFYPDLGDVFSFGIFHKKFINPIERVLQLNTGGASDITFQNADEATSIGIEGEIKKSLAGILKINGKDVLKNFSVNINAALIKSKVTFDSVNMLNVKERQMMGQSPYVVNAGLSYNHQPAKLKIYLTYNVIGKRIFIADINGGNVFEMPRNVFDLTFVKEIGKYLEIKGGIQDLLNQRVQYIQDANRDGKVQRQTPQYIPMNGYRGGDVEFWGFNRGSYFTLGLTVKL